MLHRRLAIAAALVLSLLVGPAIAPATAQEGPPTGDDGRQGTPLSTTSLTPSDTVEGYKSLSSRVAESDPELVARQDAARVPVVIKFDYDGIASYRGGIAGRSRHLPERHRAAPHPEHRRGQRLRPARGEPGGRDRRGDRGRGPERRHRPAPARRVRRCRRSHPRQPGGRSAAGRRRRRRPDRRPPAAPDGLEHRVRRRTARVGVAGRAGGGR